VALQQTCTTSVLMHPYTCEHMQRAAAVHRNYSSQHPPGHIRPDKSGNSQCYGYGDSIIFTDWKPAAAARTLCSVILLICVIHVNVSSRYWHAAHATCLKGSVCHKV